MKDISHEAQAFKKLGIVWRLLCKVSSLAVSTLERLRPGRELADLGMTEFLEGDLLCHPKGRTLIVISVHHPNSKSSSIGQFTTEYTVLCPEGTYDRISATALASWKVVAKN